MRQGRASSASGFGLVEALVALTILAVTLLMGAAGVAQHQRVVASLEARRSALLAAEAVAESVRAGAVEIESGPVRWITVPPRLPTGVALELSVTPIEPRGLATIEISASYSVRGDARRVEIHTMGWDRP